MSRGRTISRLYGMVTLPILAVALGLGAAAWAHAQQSQGYTATLAVLNNSGASGTAKATLNGTELTIEIHSTGMTPNAPHAQHLHIGGTHTCPTIAADTDKDGLINTTEGLPSYGPIMVSLTTSGDVTDASGLAVDRFPKADASGKLDYTRTFTLPSGVTADDLKNAVVVQHGVDVDKSGTYDGAKKSELDPSLPAEATLPADCGKQVAAAASAAPTTASGSPSPQAATAAPTARTGSTLPSTGDGTTAGGSDAQLMLVLIGGIGLALAAAAFAVYGVSRNRV